METADRSLSIELCLVSEAWRANRGEESPSTSLGLPFTTDSDTFSPGRSGSWVSMPEETMLSLFKAFRFDISC